MHLSKSVLSVFSIALLLSACDDGAYVNYYDKSLKNHKLECLSYIPSSNNALDKKLLTLYKFDKNCKYTLVLSYKTGIVCHSPYNVPSKVNSNFPSAFIELDVKKGFKTVYSYYKDLTSKPDTGDLENAFERLREDILK